MIQTKTKTDPKKVKKTKTSYARLAAVSTGKAAMPTDKLALMHSRYLQSVLDPWNVIGSKIPDEITTPSFPTNCMSKITATAAAGGGGGTNGVGFVYVVGSTNGSPGTKILRLAATAVADTYQTTGGYSWAPAPTLINVAQSCRPVSCGLFLNVQGATNDNQGRIIVGFLPPFDPLIGAATAVGNGVTATSLDNAAYSTSFPLSKVSGRCIFLPLDDIARSYLVSGSVATGSAGGRGAGSATYGALFVLIDGVNAATLPQIEVIASENFENVPLNAQVNIAQPEVSSSDPIEMALASNFIASRPTIAAFQPTASSITGSPLSGGGMQMTKGHASSAGGSMMDKILGGLLTGAKVAAKVAPVAAELLALL